MGRKHQNAGVVGKKRIYADGLNTGVHDLQTVYDSFSGTPTNREGFNRGAGYVLSSPTFVTSFNSGVLPGGAGQSNFNSWSYTVNLPALSFGVGNRRVFWMTGTRDANGAINNNRPPAMDGANAGMYITSGGVSTTYLTSSWDVAAEGHSDYNNLIIGGVQTDATGSTTFELQMDYSINSGGSHYMFLIVIDGVNTVTGQNIFQFNTRTSTNTVNVSVTAPSSGTAQLRMAGGASSNSGTANPVYNRDTNQTNAGIGPYTLGGSGENGTSERFGVYYDWDGNGGGKTTALGGTVTTSTNSSTGLGAAAAIVNLS